VGFALARKQMKFYFVEHLKQDSIYYYQVYCENHVDRHAFVKQLVSYQLGSTRYSYKEVPISCIKRMYGMDAWKYTSSLDWPPQFPLPK
jgi:hypothetical protein